VLYLPAGAPVRRFKAAVAATARVAIAEPWSGGVAVRVDARFARPRSHFAGGGRLRSGAPDHPGRNLGDVDNVAKAVLDALSGIAWADDCQVVELTATKSWSDADRCDVAIVPRRAGDAVL